MPGFRARELCPKGVFLQGDMKKYAAVSRQVHAIFKDFTDQIEPLALDEAFLDIGGSVNLFGSPLAIGKMIKQRVKNELDLAISVGIAPNKLVAKIACTKGKPDGLLLIRPGEVRALLDPLPIRALFGIGPKAGDRLNAAGFVTVRDLAECPVASLREVLGNQAEEIQLRARGIDERPVDSGGKAKSIGEEATFSENVLSEETVSAAITAHSEAVASRARRAGFRGKTVTLKVKLARRKTWGDKVVANHELFPVLSRQAKLPEASADAVEIRKVALALWRKLDLKEAVRLLGVTLSDLEVEHTPRQLGLFDAPPALGTSPTGASRSEILGKTMDAISERFGEGAISRAVGTVEKITQGDRLKLGQLEEQGED
jgi:DNA polymerase-4